MKDKEVRQKINRLLVQELAQMVESEPDSRFLQILLNKFIPSVKERTLEERQQISAEALLSSMYIEEPAKTYARLSKNKKACEPEII